MRKNEKCKNGHNHAHARYDAGGGGLVIKKNKYTTYLALHFYGKIISHFIFTLLTNVEFKV